MRSPQPSPKAAFLQSVTPSHTHLYRLWGVISLNDPFPGRPRYIRPLQNATAVATGSSSVYSPAFDLRGGY